MPPQNKPDLVAKALAKALSVEARLNAITGTGQSPNQPTVVYGTPATTVVTQGVSGDYTWTCPAGVFTARVECWGAGGGGGGGGSTRGGEGGGGGEYSAEPSYAVVPGNVYSYHVGNGGTGGTTGTAGVDGDASWFDISALNLTAGVTATGGTSSSGPYTGGLGGGPGAGNTVDFGGGNGGGDNTQSTGGCGGGGSGGSTGGGGSGTRSVSGTGTAGGAAGTGGGAAGGAGGNAAAGGSIGASPGGGGGGCGAATGSSQVSLSYRFTSTATYYGSDAAGGNANKTRTSNVTMYQGGETASGGTYNGTQKTLMILPSSVASDLTGVTIDSLSLKLVNIHSWYNSGMTVILGYTGFTFCGATWAGTGITSVNSFHINEGATLTQSLTSTNLGAALKSGAAKSLSLGPGSAYNLNNYGYFYGISGGGAPLLTISGHTAGSPVKAGDGADGQVKITYTPAVTTPVASVQPAPVTDPVSSAPLPAGLAGQAVTLFGVSVAPSAMAGNAVFYASTQGTPNAVLPSLLSGQLVITQVDNTNYTVTQTIGTPLSNTWSIQAGDANPGTVYRLTAGGRGTWGSTQQIMTLQLNFGSTNQAMFNIGAVAFPASQAFQWRVQGEIVVATAAGTSGTYYGALSGVLGENANQIGGVNSTTVAIVGTGASTTTFNPAIANNFLLACSWASTTGASTITSHYNILERTGP